MTTTKVLIPRVQRDSSVSSSGSELIVRGTPGRKRKLDHLTQEEKVQRKKLKNRVAAQTSRDRKKKQMEEMLVTIEKQSKELSQWEHRYNQLKSKYDKLEREVLKLKQANKSMKQEAVNHHSIPEEHKYTRLSDEETRCEDSSVGSVFIKTEGPAEGTTDENRDDRKVLNQRPEEEERCEGVIEGCNALPAIQELLDNINLEYDLEELAESLVSELHSDMDLCAPRGNLSDAKEDSNQFKLSRPLVDEPMSWSRKSRMESSKDRSQSSLKAAQPQTSSKQNAALKPEVSSEAYTTDKIFYDDEIPTVDENNCFEVHEMMDVSDEDLEDDICLKFKPSPIDRLISPIPQSEYDEIKSPLNTISDCGYESQGSPVSLHEFSSLDPQNELDLLINDLFPALA